MFTNSSMTNKVVLLTGITGFLGSHIAEHISKHNMVIGLVRNASDLWRYEEIKNNKIHLVNTEDKTYKEEIESFSPQFLIHCAWNGVSANEREDWHTQLENIQFTFRFLRLAKELHVRHFIGLGSQAEYGLFSGSVDETFLCKPVSAYGAAKLATLNVVESFCNQNSINWHWLRIFPMYGKREGLTWFIPSVIKNALQNADMNLTGCEQRYGYLYVKQFCAAIEKVLDAEAFPGVYNLSSPGSIRLRDVIEIIIKKTNTEGRFNFGALPYRKTRLCIWKATRQNSWILLRFLYTQILKQVSEKL